MRLLKALFIVLALSSVMAGQTGAPTANSGSPNIVEELKKLRQDVSEQQKAMTEQQNQIVAQQREIEALRQQVNAQPQSVSATSAGVSPRLLNATLANAGSSSSAAPPAALKALQEAQQKESPLSVRVGGAEFTPGGWVDFENIFRTTNT